MKKTKLIFVWTISVLLIMMILPFSQEKSIYSSVIRLHVLAESDSEEDQNLKLCVRDSILRYAEQNFKNTSTLEEAIEEISRNRTEIQKIANDCVKSNGYSYPVSVEFDREYYPTRFYDSLSFPSGEYLSLRVIIGSGHGKNWWCVLFPPACTNSAIDSVELMQECGISTSNINTITKNGKRYELKFKFLEIFSDFKQKISKINKK